MGKENNVKMHHIDFKRDISFKFLFNDDQDKDVVYLLKLIIESVFHIKCKTLSIMNPILTPEGFTDKQMTLDILVQTDTGEIVNVEMQNSNFNQNHYQRIQMYGSKTLLTENIRGSKNYTDNVHKIYQIIFIDDCDKRNRDLIDIYRSMNKHGQEENHSLVTRAYVQLPVINDIVKEKGIEFLNDFEQLVYIFKNTLDDAIMSVEESRVIRTMKRIEKAFTKEGLEELAAFKRELNESIIYSEGKDEGLQEGLQKGSYNNQKETTFKLLKKNFPQEDLSCFKELSYAQYKTIFDMLVEDKEFSEIKAFAENR